MSFHGAIFLDTDCCVIVRVSYLPSGYVLLIQVSLAEYSCTGVYTV